MSNNILETKNVTKIYQGNGTEVHALRGINLKVKPGELVAVMGPSGCGKSTLLHILGGLDHPTSGQVMLNGKQINQLGEAKRAVLRRKKIGIVFQDQVTGHRWNTVVRQWTTSSSTSYHHSMLMMGQMEHGDGLVTLEVSSSIVKSLQVKTKQMIAYWRNK